jgi:hypothetical protein
MAEIYQSELSQLERRTKELWWSMPGARPAEVRRAAACFNLLLTDARWLFPEEPDFWSIVTPLPSPAERAPDWLDVHETACQVRRLQGIVQRLRESPERPTPAFAETR